MPQYVAIWGVVDCAPAHLIHLGADVGFYRVGEPGFAVANGVVRISQGENEASTPRGDKAVKNMAPSPGRAATLSQRERE